MVSVALLLKVTYWHSFLTIQIPVFNLFADSLQGKVYRIAFRNFSQQSRHIVRWHK